MFILLTLNYRYIILFLEFDNPVMVDLKAQDIRMNDDFSIFVL